MNSKENQNPSSAKTRQFYSLSSLINNSVFTSFILLLVCVSVFIPSLSNDFVWDDKTFIVKSIKRLRSSNINLKHLLIPRQTSEQVQERRRKRKELKDKLINERRKSSDSIDNIDERSAINSGYANKNETRKTKRTNKYFRPVHKKSLIMEAKLWGANPFGFHLTNIILHSVSTILLYFLFLLVLKEFGVSPPRPAAFLSAMLFALYPLHVESVSFVSARGDVLAAVFFFLAFILYIFSYRRILYIIPAAISLYLSFLSKEVAIAFPIVIVGFDLISGRIKSRRSLFKYLILALAFVFYLYLRSMRHMNFLQMLGGREYLSTEAGAKALEVVTVFLNSYLFYLKKLIFPFDLNPFIGTIPGGDLVYTLISISVIAASIVIFVISIRRKENVTAFSLLWVFATLGPAVMTAIFPLAITRFAERFLYLPSAGICLLIGYLIIKAGQKLGRLKLAYLLGAGLCVVFLIVTLRGQAVWKNSLSLWEYAVMKSPREIVPKIKYAYSLVEAGRSDEAIAQYSYALNPETFGNNEVKARAADELGDIYLTRGDIENASRYYKASVSISPSYQEEYYYKMGLISAKKNNPQLAEDYMLKAIDLNPRKYNAYYVLGNIYFVRAGVENNPSYYTTASNYLEIAASFKRSVPETNLLLAKIYAQLGDPANAKEQAQAAIQKGIEAKGLSEARAILNLN